MSGSESIPQEENRPNSVPDFGPTSPLSDVSSPSYTEQDEAEATTFFSTNAILESDTSSESHTSARAPEIGTANDTNSPTEQNIRLLNSLESPSTFGNHSLNTTGSKFSSSSELSDIDSSEAETDKMDFLDDSNGHIDEDQNSHHKSQLREIALSNLKDDEESYTGDEDSNSPVEETAEKPTEIVDTPPHTGKHEGDEVAVSVNGGRADEVPKEESPATSPNFSENGSKAEDEVTTPEKHAQEDVQRTPNKRRKLIPSMEETQDPDVKTELLHPNDFEDNADEEEDIENEGEDEDDEDEREHESLAEDSKSPVGDSGQDLHQESRQAERTPASNEQRLEAIELLKEIEVEFADLRDKLYQDKLSQLTYEMELCASGQHPELIKIFAKINEHYESKLRSSKFNLTYKLECVDNQTRAGRIQLHQQFLKDQADLKLNLLNETTKEWYKVNRERRLLDNLVPEYSYQVAGVSRTSLVTQRNNLLLEIGELNGLNYYHGFPAAPNIRSANIGEVEDDLESMGIKSG